MLFAGAAHSYGQGLTAQYFADSGLGDHFQGQPVTTQVDPMINFDFKATPPQNLGVGDNFSARWKGKIKPLYSETYLLMTLSDDGVRLTVNGQVLIDNFTNHPPTWNWNWITFQAGQEYDIQIDYFQGIGWANLQLWWQSQHQQKELVPASQLEPLPTSGAQTYFVSPTGLDSNSGLSPDQAWSSITRVNSQTYNPGDKILFGRNGRYAGSLRPQGSGTAPLPITVSAYGAGSLPIIDGAGQEEPLRLFNQQYWNIDSLELTGGIQYGVFVSGDVANTVLHGIHLTNLQVHDIYSEPRWDSGLVMVASMGDHLTCDDVLVDGITAYNTNLWYGIHVGFNLWYSYPTDPPRTTNVVIRNSTVHHVYGDGITAAQSQNVLIEKNVVFETGLAPAGVSYTPNGIWSWQCDNTTIQFNEGYSTHSYSFDGGVFDVDWGSTNTIIQYNYAHDADGYCVAVMGAHHVTTSNSIVRFNTCANNGRKASVASSQGDIYVVTFDGGSLDGIQIYNNTATWNPAVDGAWIVGRNVWVTGSLPRFLMNNLVYSTARTMIDLDNIMGMDRNLYWSTNSSSPVWKYQASVFQDFGQFRSNTGQDWNGLQADPMLANPMYHGIGAPITDFLPAANSPAVGSGTAWSMGGRDFYGNAVPDSGSINIGSANRTQ